MVHRSPIFCFGLDIPYRRGGPITHLFSFPLSRDFLQSDSNNNTLPPPTLNHHTQSSSWYNLFAYMDPNPQASFCTGSFHRNNTNNHRKTYWHGHPFGISYNNSHQRSAPQTQPQSAIKLSLGDIAPIQDALAYFTDDSEIMSRFSQFCADREKWDIPNRVTQNGDFGKSH